MYKLELGAKPSFLYIYILEVLYMSIVKDMNLAARGRQKIAWVKDFMPTLTEIGRELAAEQTFAGLKIGMSIHMEAKTAYLATILKAAGARVYATGCNSLSTQDDVAAGLASLGVEVYAIHGVGRDEYRHHLRLVLENKPDLIIDDGGDLLEVYRTFPSYAQFPVIGGCEETTTGIMRLRQLERTNTLPFPMMDINDADCKHLYDNRYGTGQSVWDAIMHTTNVLVAGKTVVVAGYGWCGRGVAMRARGMGARVIVTEINPVKAIEANLDGFDVMSMNKAAQLGDYFITVTGCKDVITDSHFLLMKDNAFLANAGHFDVEINLKQLREQSRSVAYRRDNILGYTLKYNNHTLNVLAGGRLVNLAGGNGHPAEIMDMSFSLQSLGLKYLAQHRDQLERKVYNVPTDIDQFVAWRKLRAMDITIDELTIAQRSYLGLD